MGKKKLLTDVVIIRPLIIGLLVVYHAFIIYIWVVGENLLGSSLLKHMDGLQIFCIHLGCR